jgi:hypothetical protein
MQGGGTMKLLLGIAGVLSMSSIAGATQAFEVYRQVEVKTLLCAGTDDSSITFSVPAQPPFLKEAPISLDLCEALETSAQFPVEFFLKEGKVIGAAMNNEYQTELNHGLVTFSNVL